MTKRISTAAYLAGVTTLAVSLPMMASAKATTTDVSATAKTSSDVVQVDTREAE